MRYINMELDPEKTSGAAGSHGSTGNKYSFLENNSMRNLNVSIVTRYTGSIRNIGQVTMD